MEIKNLSQYAIVALIPTYNEKEEELRKTIDSFAHDSGNVKFFIVIIIDGFEESIDLIHKILNLKIDATYVTEKHFKYLFHINKHDFLIVVKNENRGKHDSQLLFLNILNNSIIDKSTFFKKNKISVLMLDSDTSFHANSVIILHDDLWQQADDKVVAITGIVYARTRWFNILECSQYFEYLISHLFRKHFESLLKSVICLQGNFSLFKMSMLLESEVLGKFSAPQKSIVGLHDSLGEDRFLSSIILKEGYRTIYTSKSIALTTVPSNLVNYILQRKRWNNSILSSYLKFLFTAEKKISWYIKFYIGLDLVGKIIAPAIMFQLYIQFTFTSNNYLVHQFSNSDIKYFMIVLIAFMFISCTHAINKYRKFWNILCLISIIVYSIIIYEIWLNSFKALIGKIYLSDDQKYLLAIQTVFSLCILIRTKQFIKNLYYWLCNLLIVPVTAVISPIYAFSRFDDFTWGNRNLNVDKDHFKIDKTKFRLVKYYLLMCYLLINFSYIFIGFYFSMTALNILLLCYICLNFVPVFFFQTISKLNLTIFLRKNFYFLKKMFNKIFKLKFLE